MQRRLFDSLSTPWPDRQLISRGCITCSFNPECSIGFGSPYWNARKKHFVSANVVKKSRYLAGHLNRTVQIEVWSLRPHRAHGRPTGACSESTYCCVLSKSKHALSHAKSFQFGCNRQQPLANGLRLWYDCRLCVKFVSWFFMQHWLDRGTSKGHLYQLAARRRPSGTMSWLPG